MTTAPSAVRGPVLVIGCGLLGTSIGLALGRLGVAVHLCDLLDGHVELAQSVGAGTSDAPAGVGLVVVAVPPDHVAQSVVDALGTWPDAVVTDVSSVKAGPLELVEASGVDPSRYVGGHPMAGSARSGPLAASAALFEGRVWAVTPHERAHRDAVQQVHALARACGASVLELGPGEHDAAVARVSHLPHLLSVLTAAQLTDGPPDHLKLAGQGLRDVTRVAGGDPWLWRQIISANASPIADLLRSVRGDIDVLLESLTVGPDVVGRVLSRGLDGTRLIPGKHGMPERDEAAVFVQVADKPGELARLFSDTQESEINIEDLRIDHEPGRPVGLAEIAVRQHNADRLVESLNARGWTAYR